MLGCFCDSVWSSDGSGFDPIPPARLQSFATNDRTTCSWRGMAASSDIDDIRRRHFWLSEIVHLCPEGEGYDAVKLSTDIRGGEQRIFMLQDPDTEVMNDLDLSVYDPPTLAGRGSFAKEDGVTYRICRRASLRMFCRGPPFDGF